ncbi:MAG: protease inhibitor I9 family protein, partial [Verrucomicrobia bacterium]|nr:protease inhibitor I9 family protein [Verrucomicrobiota bacterium]
MQPIVSKSRVVCFVVGVLTASGMLLGAGYGPKSSNSARYIVRLKPGVGSFSAYSSRSGIEIDRVFTRAIHGFAGVLSEEAVGQLEQDHNVLQVVPDLPVFAIGKPDKPDKPDKPGKGHGKPGSNPPPPDDIIP